MPLTEVETRNTARRAFQSNPKLTSSEIGKAIGRSRQSVDSYIADLRATTLLELNLKIFCLNLLGIPQDRIAKRLGIPQRTLSDHSAKMPELANPPNSDLSKGFTVPQVAQKHDWPEPIVWSQALKGKDDQARFKELNWGIRTYPKGQKLRVYGILLIVINDSGMSGPVVFLLNWSHISCIFFQSRTI